MSGLYFGGCYYETKTVSSNIGTKIEARSAKTGLESKNKELYEYLRTDINNSSMECIMDSYNEYKESLEY